MYFCQNQIGGNPLQKRSMHVIDIEDTGPIEQIQNVVASGAASNDKSPIIIKPRNKKFCFLEKLKLFSLLYLQKPNFHRLANYLFKAAKTRAISNCKNSKLLKRKPGKIMQMVINVWSTSKYLIFSCILNSTFRHRTRLRDCFKLKCNFQDSKTRILRCRLLSCNQVLR